MERIEKNKENRKDCMPIIYNTKGSGRMKKLKKGKNNTMKANNET
jgi:hypothetical protein